MAIFLRAVQLPLQRDNDVHSMLKNKYIDRAFDAARKEIAEDENLTPAKLLYRSSTFRTPASFFYKRFDSFKDTPKTDRHSATEIYSYAVYLENSDIQFPARALKALGASLYAGIYMKSFARFTMELVEENCGFFYAVAAANLIYQLRTFRNYEVVYIIDTIRAIAINDPNSMAEVLDKIYQSAGNSKTLIETAREIKQVLMNSKGSNYSI